MTEEQQPLPENAPQEVKRVPVQVHLSSETKNTLVTNIIMGVTIAIYAIQYLSQNLIGYDLPAILGAKINDYILAGQYWRLFTPMLLHGSPAHIFVNMYALYNIGRGLERYYGHKRYLALYFLGGFAGNVLSFIFTKDASLGASTAIFGLLAAQGVLVYQNRAWFGKNYRPVIMNILGIAALNLIFGFTVQGIDNMGHLGGILGGALYAWFAGPKWDIQGIFPDLELIDQRPEKAWMTGFLYVALLFTGITIVAILLNIPK